MSAPPFPVHESPVHLSLSPQSPFNTRAQTPACHETHTPFHYTHTGRRGCMFAHAHRHLPYIQRPPLTKWRSFCCCWECRLDTCFEGCRMALLSRKTLARTHSFSFSKLHSLALWFCPFYSPSRWRMSVIVPAM